MPVGPNDGKRPADVIANAVLSMQIATGDAEEQYMDEARRKAALKGGVARATAVGAERRSQIAKEGATARWG